MKTILITGSGGFIGYHLAKRLISEDWQVIGVDNINDYYDVNLKYARLKDLGISRNEIKVGKLIKSQINKRFLFIQLGLEDTSLS